MGYWGRRGSRRGFTLIELLLVITIIVITSVIAIPVIVPAIGHRQVSEAARILQGAIVGARDAAIHDNAPSGIRLRPDPAFSGIGPATLANGQPNPFAGIMDPTQPLAYSRVIPIASPPAYSEGLVNVITSPDQNQPLPFQIPYPVPTAVGSGDFYPIWGAAVGVVTNTNVLMVEESVGAISAAGALVPNSPTSWYWNIRVGDKIQINGAGIWYTVVGPMTIPPQGATINGQFIANPELFVNIGVPGTVSSLVRTLAAGTTVNPEFLFLVNGIDDNGNGWVDEGWDGVDNDLAAEVAAGRTQYTDDLLEWENETWPPSIAVHGVKNVAYTIQRRPAPSPNAREIALPTQVVIDATTWGNAQPERSRFPAAAMNPFTGELDLIVNPDGTVVPTTLYSSPSSLGMTGAFWHFFLAERSDIAAPNAGATAAPFLPVGVFPPPPNQETPVPYTGPTLRGEYSLLTLFTKTGQLISGMGPAFENPAQDAANNRVYNVNAPFIPAQQGVQGP